MRKSIIALTPLMIAPLCWAQEKPNVVIFLVDDVRSTVVLPVPGEPVITDKPCLNAA